MIHIDIITVQPKMFGGFLGESIVSRAVAKGLCSVSVVDLRDFAEGSYRKVDDAIYGGGPGMLMMCAPWFAAVERCVAAVPDPPGGRRVVMTTPQGRRFAQKDAQELSRAGHVVFMCGHYEGFDERIRTLATDEFSIGDFVMTGGEIAAAAMADAAVRLVPGVLGGGAAAVANESFSDPNLLEPPQYTRPADFRGMKVPEVLLGGDHAAVEAWRRGESLKRTVERRPDLAGGDR